MAMKEGGCLLVDEISLADDAVLERLNSVLEPERKLVISERSRCRGKDVFQIAARDGFQFLATMNPGGDYGKKEVCVCLSVCLPLLHLFFPISSFPLHLPFFAVTSPSHFSLFAAVSSTAEQVCGDLVCVFLLS